MSTGAQVAVLNPRGIRSSQARSDRQPIERPLVRLAAFAALASYGSLRWATMLSPAPVWRVLGLLALTVAVAGAVPPLRLRSRSLAVLAAVVAVVAMFALAGLPLAWIRHARIAVTADAIGQGLSALPQVLVPYTGINDWVRVVILLGAGVLLLDAAMMLAFAPRPLSELRRGAAALPLVVLAVVPSTLARPDLVYVHGLILFALLAALVWGERIPGHALPTAVAAAGLAGAAGLAAAPVLDQHSPWLNYQALAGTLSPGQVETFDWSQNYGPLNWPRTGRQVLSVRAAHPDYWKSEDLDLFNGSGWAAGSTDYGIAPPQPSPASLHRWTQTIQVTLHAMQTSDVIAAGFAARPDHLPQAPLRGNAPGTWTALEQLQPGDSYRITTYSPQPTEAQLAAAGTAYPTAQLQGDLTIELPQIDLPPGQILFAPFGSGSAPQDIANLATADAGAELAASRYGRAYQLAQRLAVPARTPYAFVQNVLRYLRHNYSYNEDPPPSAYPLDTFLFEDKIGYCQQFAGAMALLLRMGGVPARVATGFTSGTYDSARGEWGVSDVNAHAWVEAWFPGLGWVRFDPTPPAAPARGGHASLGAIPYSARTTRPAPRAKGPQPQQPLTSGRQPARQSGSGATVWTGVVCGAIALLALLGLTARRRRLGPPTSDELLDELERALQRSGRPLSGGVTLVTLETRFRASPDAAAYVRALRLSRFAGARQLPTREQRRALRAQLGAGLGVLGRLRALWALPPRWRALPKLRLPSARGLHSS